MDEVTQKDRDDAWQGLFDAAGRVREVLIADNGGSTLVDPEDEFLGNMIAEMDRIRSMTGITW
jgi:hypothetical protein